MASRKPTKMAMDRSVRPTALIAEKKPGKLLEVDTTKKERAKISQREKQKKGSLFEREWKASMKIFNCFVYKFLTGYEGTPFDFVMVSPIGAYALELKNLSRPNVGYSSIRYNQRIGLEQFRNETLGFGRPFVVVNTTDLITEATYLVPWEDIREKVLSGAPGSFDVRHWPSIDRLLIKYEKNGEQAKEWIWDISSLTGPPKEEWLNAYTTAKNRLADIRRGGYGFTPTEYGAIKEAFDAAQSRLFAQAAAEAAALGLPPPDFPVPKRPSRKMRYPTTRRPSNGPIRNPKTWGNGKGIGRYRKDTGQQTPAASGKV